jgi:hypothetical protein
MSDKHDQNSVTLSDKTAKEEVKKPAKNLKSKGKG